MHDLNPYECTQSLAPLLPRRMDWASHALACTPGATVVVVAAVKYPVSAGSLDGAMAGTILVVVGYVVGRVLASEATSRPIGILMSGSFALALCAGWVDHPGGESTLWAFSCMSAGLLAGACTAPACTHDSREPTDVELMPTGAEETSRLN